MIKKITARNNKIISAYIEMWWTVEKEGRNFYGRKFYTLGSAKDEAWLTSLEVYDVEVRVVEHQVNSNSRIVWKFPVRHRRVASESSE